MNELISNLMKTPIERYVIARVKELRIGRGLSQVKLADIIDVKQSFIGEAESDKFPTKYNLNHLFVFAKFFNCSIKDFFPDDIEEVG